MSKCTKCGAEFECSADEKCWCMTVPLQPWPSITPEACLCPICLRGNNYMSDVQPIVDFIWDGKYRHKQPDGSTVEMTREDTLSRAAKAVYANDKVERLAEAMEKLIAMWWAPAGRIIAGAGTGRRVTLINCFVSPDLQDSLITEDALPGEGIMDALRTAAVTMQMGGGIGMDFSTLRPRGAIVKRTGSVSSGVLHFMDTWDSMCRTIMSSGSRRGAMMATLRCDHPDLFEFIRAKHVAGRLTNFNVSVLITDPFMEAVQENLHWELIFNVPRADNTHVRVFTGEDGSPQYVYESIPARQIWEAITSSTYEFAEPGVIFIDRVNSMNNLAYCEVIHCTNPCGEQPLPANGDCNLGAVNLAKMVLNPFTDKARLNLEAIESTTRVGLRFLDNVLDVTDFPTEAQRKEAMNKRRTGLGITGLANMLQQMCVRYGSNEAVELTGQVMALIRNSAYDESVNLASERGPFPFYSTEYLDRPFIKNLPKSLQKKIKANGIRNGVILTIAPTGTTSIFYDNVSSGLEPTFMWEYDRKVLQPDGTHKTFETVYDYGYKVFLETVAWNEGEPLPDYMVTANDLTVNEHLKMQGVCQSFVDSSISKTINCPKEIPIEDFRDVYSQAYEMGLKGCTTYRPSDVRGSVLSAKKEKPTVPVLKKRPRSQVLEGKSYKIKWAELPAFYVTINDELVDGKRVPFEIFINSKSVKHQEWMAALTRMISAIFRRGGDVSFLVEELCQVYSAEGGAWVNGAYVPSLVALIGSTIETHMSNLGLMGPEQLKKDEIKPDIEEGPHQTLIRGEICDKCNSSSVFHKEGCSVCASCGHSTCG